MKKILILITVLMLPSLAAAIPVRVKDLADFDGVRGNDLVGYGLVVGLDGSGDSMRNAPFTEDMLTGMLERLGVNTTGDALRSKNVAAVIVTASLPPFARSGSKIDVDVSAIGDAKSLLGGTLVMTRLRRRMATSMRSRRGPSLQVGPRSRRRLRVLSRGSRLPGRSLLVRALSEKWNLISRNWKRCGLR